MITEFKTIPKAVYYVQTADGCTVLDPDGDTLAEITAPGGYFPGIAAADGGPGTVTFSAPVKRVVGPFDLAPQLLLTLLGQLGGNGGLPAGYKRVEYLQSDGGQYISTNVQPHTETVFELQVQQERSESWLFGRKGQTEGAMCLLNLGGNAEGAGWIAYGNGDTSSTRIQYVNFPSYVIGQTARVVLKNTGLTIDNEIWDFFTEIPENSDPPIFVFARNSTEGYLPMTGKMWYFRAIENKPIINLVPVLDATGAPCMYDLVSRKPFYNSGTGDFIYPAESTTYALRRVLPDWGKLTENGLRRLYHAPANYRGELYDYALENGYKPIIEHEKPETGYWSPRWTETADEIVLEWVETEPPMDEYLTQPTE